MHKVDVTNSLKHYARFVFGQAGMWDAPMLGEELYDHTGDEGGDFDTFPLGHRNVVQDPEVAADVKRLRSQAVHFFRYGNATAPAIAS